MKKFLFLLALLALSNVAYAQEIPANRFVIKTGGTQCGATIAVGPQMCAGSAAPEGAKTAVAGSIYLRTNGSIYVKSTGSGNTGWTLLATGTGDVVGPSSSVDSEFALFDSTTGKLLKRASGTGVAHATSGVFSVGTVTCGEGGTGLTTGTSGGILAFTASCTLVSSGALTANLPVIGGGAGVAPSVGTRSGNTTKFVTTTGSFATDDCVKFDVNGNAVSAGSSCGTGAGTVTPSSTDTFTNKTLDAEATGNIITIPFTYNFVVAICQNATATLGLSTPTSNPAVAACVTGSNTQFGVAQFADGANTLSMQGHFTLFSDWTGNIDLSGKWRTSATTGNVVWQLSTICVADGETSDPSFNTASTVTEGAKGTTLQQNDFSISSVTITGCAAGEELYFKFFRDPTNGSDTLAATAELISLVFTVRRTM